MNFNKVSNIAALGLFLAVFCGVSAVVMAYCAIKTKEPIERKKMQNTQSSLASILPKFDNNLTENTFTLESDDGFSLKFYGAFLDGKLAGIAVETLSKMGYGGEVDAVISLNLDGSVRSMVVTKHNETPGLGSVVCERKEAKTIFDLFGKKEKAEGLPPNRFLDWYNGKKLPESGWKVAKDGGEAEYMTGATVTCRALSDLANRAVRTFSANQQRIIDGISKKGEAAK